MGDVEPELRNRIARTLAAKSGADVELIGLRAVSSGASRHTYEVEIRADKQPDRLVLQLDRAGTTAPVIGPDKQAALLARVAPRGVPVPAVIAASGSDADLGAPYLLTRSVPGTALPRHVLRDPQLAPARASFAADSGRILATLHHTPTDALPDLPDGDPLEQLVEAIDELGEARPAFELAIRWLRRHRVPPTVDTPRLVHGDFRFGNLILGPDGIRAVLDWELTHLGDPLEDLGWLCVKAWRFGSGLPVGGLGTIDDLVTSYEDGGGVSVWRDALFWWYVLGTLRWGVICLQQAHVHLDGHQRSVELAAIGRRACEVEYDLLQVLP